MAGNLVSSKPVHTLWGIVVALFMLVQFAVLSVVLITFEMYSDKPATNASVFALIAIIAAFVFYIAALVRYFGRGPGMRPNKSRAYVKTPPE
jgi:uncharacterized membrane protein YdbT with pleckstrin-like domain